MPSPKEYPIKTTLRIRPRNKQEIAANSATVVKPISATKAELTAKAGGKNDQRTYNYDNVFGSEASQLEVYDAVVAPCLEEVLQGFNCTVFAYGQTGTGKTHTMEGDRSDEIFKSYRDDPGAGMIPRALHHLFEKLEECEGVESAVKVSFLEIYNEEIFDLLGHDALEDGKRLRLFEDANRKGSVIINGLEEVSVYSKHDVFDILTRGAERRRTAETKMNKASSRSHSVFSVTVHQKESSVATGEELLKTGKLYLVDLAGAENIGRSGAMNARAAEAGNINKSLLTLGRVISKLVERSAHIPYRESKLTRLLQDSLGGRTKTSIIATVSPAQLSFEESQSTMDYALRAKSIMNKPEVNAKLTKKEVMKEYAVEIEKLKKDLLASREKNGVFLSKERYDDMESAIESQRENVKELTEKIEATTAQLEKITALFSDTSAKLETTSATLKSTEKTLQETSTKLVHVEEENEEKGHLINVHQDSEAKLIRTNTTLVGVADISTQHVSALHEKVARKATVEATNAQAVEQTKSIVASNISAISDRMGAYAQTQKSMLAGITSSLQAFVDDNTATLNDAISGLESLQGGIAHHTQTVTGICATNTDAATVAASEFSTMTRTAQNTFGKTITGHTEETRQAHDALRAMVAEQHTRQTTFAATVAATIAEATRATDAFASANAAALSALQQTVAAHVEHQQASSRAQCDLIDGTQTERTASLQCAMQEMQASMQRLFDDFAARQTAHFATDAATLQRRITADAAVAESFQTDMGAAVAGMTGTTETYVAGQAAAFDATTAAVSTEIGAATVMLENVEGNSQQRVAAVEAHGTVVQTHMCDMVAMIETETATSMARNAQCTADIIASVTDHNAATTASCAAAVSSISAAKDKQTMQCSETTKAIVDTAEDIADKCTMAQSDLHGAQIAVDKHIGESFARDVPTGATPQRQAYHFPREIPSPLKHTAILESFRTQKSLSSLSANVQNAIEGDVAVSEVVAVEAPVQGKENADTSDAQTTSKTAATGPTKIARPLGAINKA
eukprot:m.1352773 g.1352773  ORF g.1352773 m.1352773 type:complete len:1030 (+) comp24927_c0_seq6:103-3192(+)